jgi:hypothetical protein
VSCSSPPEPPNVERARDFRIPPAGDRPVSSDPRETRRTHAPAEVVSNIWSNCALGAPSAGRPPLDCAALPDVSALINREDP